MLQLTSRERWIAIVSTSVLLLLAGYGWLIKPTLARTQRLYQVIPEKRQTLARLQAQHAKVEVLNSRMTTLQQQLQKSGRKTALLSQLETTVDQHGLKENLTSMTPEPPIMEGNYSVTLVEIRFEDVSFRRLLTFLREVKADMEAIRIGLLHITPGTSSAGLLNTTVRLHCPSAH
ncbi:type II secretion system protein GspM [Planctomycetota bacterium]